MNKEQIEKLQQERAVLIEHITQLKALTGQQKNDLPDDSFAVISPGGKKDESGRTVPRSLRHLPYKTASGELDKERVIAAWAVLNGARGGVDLPHDLHERALLIIRKARQKLGLGDERMSSDEISQKTFTTFAKIYETEEKIAQPSQSVTDVLSLNDKLISTLEQADGQIQTLTQLNQKLLADLKALDEKTLSDVSAIKTELETFKQKEQQAKMAQFDSVLNHVTKKWCEIFAISDPVQQENARKMLSTFQSEDKLTEIQGFLEHKLTQMANMPRPVTKQSGELVAVQESKRVVMKPFEQMSEQEKREYTDKLHAQLVKISKR